MQLEIADIRQDGGTQPRAMLHAALADEYAEAMREGAQFPPVVVFYDGTSYWLADGFHRVFAAGVAGLTTIEADVRQGTQADAQWYSYSANKAHGKRRSDEDKRRAVEAALAHPYHAQFSNRQIAEHIGVSADYISRVTPSIDRSIDRPAVRTVTRNGTTYQQNTANIGKSKISKPDADDDALPFDEPPHSPHHTHRCATCQEWFGAPVWHCEHCGTHTHEAERVCGDCHQPRASVFTPIQEMPDATEAEIDAWVDETIRRFNYSSGCRYLEKLAARYGLEVRE